MGHLGCPEPERAPGSVGTNSYAVKIEYYSRSIRVGYPSRVRQQADLADEKRTPFTQEVLCLRRETLASSACAS